MLSRIWGSFDTFLSKICGASWDTPNFSKISTHLFTWFLIIGYGISPLQFLQISTPIIVYSKTSIPCRTRNYLQAMNITLTPLYTTGPIKKCSLWDKCSWSLWCTVNSRKRMSKKYWVRLPHDIHIINSGKNTYIFRFLRFRASLS